MEATFQQRWSQAWNQKTFKKQVIAGTILLIAVLAFLPFFFNAVELRQGYVINDWLLNKFNPINVSIPVFSIIWCMALLTVTRCIQQPKIFVLFLWSFVLLSFLRIITISMVPLNPPLSLLELKDPLSNTFYGSKFITKDLFFSGHTSTQFIMYLCLRKKSDKILTLIASIAVGILVLVQHIHYTIDVLAAFPFAYLVYWAAKKITGNK